MKKPEHPTKGMRLSVRIAPVDARRLAKLAKHYEAKEAHVIRMLIKRDFESLFGEQHRREAAT